MPNATVRANATALPADRRAFLAGALAAPFTVPGPSQAQGSVEPQIDNEAASAPATFDDYAKTEFQALNVQPDMKEARKTFDSQWLPIAIALKTMSKDHNAVSDLFEEMCHSDDIPFQTMAEALEAGEAYMRNAADVLSSAHTRLLCGACRAL